MNPGRPKALASLQRELRRGPDARYYQRLTAVLLVTGGLATADVAQRLGVSVRSLQYWLRGYESRGLPALAEKNRRGRAGQLDAAQRRELALALMRPPTALGRPDFAWTGAVLAGFIAERWGLVLGLRQCQRLLQSLKAPKSGAK